MTSGPNQRTAIFVLGMHRSGSSALAGAVHLLGAAAPRTLMPSDMANPRGYWESEKIVAVHDEILQSVGSSWEDWRSVGPELAGSPGAADRRPRE